MPPRLHTDRTSGKQNQFSRNIGLKRQEMSQLRRMELLTELVEFPYSDPAGTGLNSLSYSIYGIFPIAKCVLTDSIHCLLLTKLTACFSCPKTRVAVGEGINLRKFHRPQVLLSIPPVFLFKQLTFRFGKHSLRILIVPIRPSFQFVLSLEVLSSEGIGLFIGGGPFPYRFFD